MLNALYVAKYILRFITKNSPQVIIFKRFLTLTVFYLVLDTICYFIKHRKRPKLVRILLDGIIFGIIPLFQLSRDGGKKAIPDVLQVFLKGVLVWEAWWYPKWTYGFYSIMVSKNRKLVTVFGLGAVAVLGVSVDFGIFVYNLVQKRRAKLAKIEKSE